MALRVLDSGKGEYVGKAAAFGGFYGLQYNYES